MGVVKDPKLSIRFYLKPILYEEIYPLQMAIVDSFIFEVASILYRFWTLQVLR
jgi:hypothetical protein